MKSTTKEKEATTATAPAPERGIHPEHREAAERLIARGRQQGSVTQEDIVRAIPAAEPAQGAALLTAEEEGNLAKSIELGEQALVSPALSVIHLYELGVEVKKRMALGRPKEFVDEATRFTNKSLRFTLGDEEGGKELKRVANRLL